MANNIPSGMRKYHVQVCTDLASDEPYGVKYTSFNIKAYNKDQLLDQLNHYFITELEDITNAT